MKIKITILAILVLMTALPLIADYRPNSFFNPNLDNRSFFNVDNMQTKHTMSFMSGFSSDGRGVYKSSYTNHIMYQFSPNLDLQVDLNFVNHGTIKWDNDISISSNNDNTTNVIPEFSLNYRPTENSRITIEYRQSISPFHDSNWRW